MLRIHKCKSLRNKFVKRFKATHNMDLNGFSLYKAADMAWDQDTDMCKQFHVHCFEIYNSLHGLCIPKCIGLCHYGIMLFHHFKNWNGNEDNVTYFPFEILYDCQYIESCSRSLSELSSFLDLCLLGTKLAEHIILKNWKHLKEIFICGIILDGNDLFTF